MIYHVVPLADWDAAPGSAYAPASLADEGFVHCSPDVATTLAVADAFYRDAPRPLLALVVDESRLTATCVFEAAAPAPPPGVAADTLFPHVFGPIDRAAVTEILQVTWDAGNHATGLADRG
ncbi:DUF952 domain-containing protein [Streptacidiphilus melanogenes]|uniref:DUF952 domain-containing protein n=1 Tax=Streptacidiphilus melanogenes TaxID=411235 RepID=UPI0005A7F740|nr:DUF952 domain-containing protein [Streptacidiphilus melanogenes]